MSAAEQGAGGRAGLSEEERWDLLSASHRVEPIHMTGEALFGVVERIVAERVAAAREDARAVIEAAIREVDLPVTWTTIANAHHEALDLAARVAAGVDLTAGGEGAGGGAVDGNEGGKG